MTENKSNLFRLLDLDPFNQEEREKLDGNAIIKEVQKNPGSAESKYRFSCRYLCFPLIQALHLKASVDVLDALCTPQVIRNELIGDRALHIALVNKLSLRVVSFLLNKWPKAPQTKKQGGFTPLHIACQCHPSLNVLLLLLHFWPNALREKNVIGDTPLHWAIKMKAPWKVLSFLVKSGPDVLGEKDTSQNTPLHLLCENIATLEVVSLFLDIRLDALSEKNNFGFTPLHLACRKDVSLEVVTLLLDGWAGALRETNECLDTPLSLACKKKASLDVVSLLLDSWPDALRLKDSNGCTPLHCVCGFAAPIEVAFLLLEMCPDAIIERNNNGETPFDQAQTSGAHADILSLMFHVTCLWDDRLEKPPPKEIITFFFKIKWWNGVVLTIDRFPTVAQNIDLNISIMPDFLFVVGYRCKLKTMMEVISNNLDLIA